MICVKVFAQYREQLGFEEVSMEYKPSMTVKQVMDNLSVTYPLWSTVVKPGHVLCAVNHELTSFDHELADNDELAFFPPVTGG